MRDWRVRSESRRAEHRRLHCGQFVNELVLAWLNVAAGIPLYAGRLTAERTCEEPVKCRGIPDGTYPMGLAALQQQEFSDWIPNMALTVYGFRPCALLEIGDRLAANMAIRPATDPAISATGTTAKERWPPASQLSPSYPGPQREI